MSKKQSDRTPSVARMHLQPVCAWHGYSIDHDLVMFDQVNGDAEAEAKQQAIYDNWRETACSMFGLGRSGSNEKPFAYSDGVAIIPVHGTLINRFGGSWGFVTGYTYIRRMTMLADADPEVSLIVYDNQSNGGEVAGCPETAKVIADAETPTLSVIDARSFSAAYWIASQTDRVAIIGSGMTGSIGAMTMHVDYSENLENAGIKVTLMRSGDHKTDGNPYGALPDDVRKATEVRLNGVRQQFAEAVANGRGISVESVLATEANCYTAEEALSLGLVDEISNPSDVISRIMVRLSAGRDPFGDDEEIDTEEDKAMADDKGKTQPVVPAAVAETGAEDKAAAVVAERLRIKTITTHENAASQAGVAEYLAYETNMSADEASAILSKITTVAAEAPNPETKGKPEGDQAALLNAAMKNTPNPEIPPEGNQQAQVSEVDAILALANGEQVK